MNLPAIIINQLEAEGYRACVLPSSHLPEIQDEIIGHKKDSLFDINFYHECLAWFDFRIPDELPRAQSIMVVAVSQPQVRLNFQHNGDTISRIVPPTYNYHVNNKVHKRLSELMKTTGYRVVPARLPVKLLAVRNGLGRYGRNNLCYIPDLGSYHRLMAFYTNMPGEDDHWHDSKMLDRCQKCNACLEACPTGAIGTDRFMLHAERCLTFHNERKGDFPDWIDPSWHHCIVGCMFCQNSCPENRKVKSLMIEGEMFSQKETKSILEYKFNRILTEQIDDKLTKLGIEAYMDILPRNLRALFELN